MSESLKRIGILTSSRADFGIYQPLIEALSKWGKCNLEIIAFGSHFFSGNGHTIEEIHHVFSGKVHEITGFSSGTSLSEISDNFSETYSRLQRIWQFEPPFDLLFALGDRYEMAAAVMSTVPYQIPIAHLHGGEITLGAIDQIYRDAISLASKLHFTSTAKAKDRVEHILGPMLGFSLVEHVGSIVIDKILDAPLMSDQEFFEKFSFDLSQPFYLITIHPETVVIKDNEYHVNEFERVVDWVIHETPMNLLVTLPNADPGAEIWRSLWDRKSKFSNRVFCYENLGVKAYYTAMKRGRAMIGNSSSGIIESAAAGTWVLNLGSRQEGREFNANTYPLQFEFQSIVQVLKGLSEGAYSGPNVYGSGNSVKNIMQVIEKYLNR